MIIHILTLFPKIFDSVFSQSIIKKAQQKKIVELNIINIRDFALDLHKTVDDKPYGGGKGMILKVDIIMNALESIKPKPFSILLSASGKQFHQKTAKKFAKKKQLALICGHYEGVDVRVENYVDEVISIGDFVLTGGEIAAMAIVDSVTRLKPGVIHPESLKFESFNLNSQLEFPQYTRPESFRGLKVPRTLISGNHRKIEKWRKSQSQIRTNKFKKNLIGKE